MNTENLDPAQKLQRAIERQNFAEWRKYFHPQQAEYIFCDFDGALSLSGGAGTGKTVILINRALYLARQNPNARVILTTFSKSLATDLRETLQAIDPNARVLDENQLGEPGIYIQGIDAIVHQVLVSAAQPDLFGASALEDAVTKVFGESRTGFNAGFADLPYDIKDEYRSVIVPLELKTREEYLAAERPSHLAPLNSEQRNTIWDQVESFRSQTAAAGQTDWVERAQIATAYLQQHAQNGLGRLADHVLVDEAQDFEPSRMLFVRALVAPGKNDLVIAEDAQQQIYGTNWKLSDYGIEIPQSSQRLTLNYRITEQNLDYGTNILSNVQWQDLNGDSVDTQGYTPASLRLGPPPTVVGLATKPEAYETVVAQVKNWLARGVEPEAIAIVSVKATEAESIQQFLQLQQIPARFLNDSDPINTDQVLVMTMHRAKGMEFRDVIIFDDAAGSSYLNHPEYQQPHSLLYVAATRARDELVVIWNEKPSELIRINLPSDSSVETNNEFDSDQIVSVTEPLQLEIAKLLTRAETPATKVYAAWLNLQDNPKYANLASREKEKQIRSTIQRNLHLDASEYSNAVLCINSILDPETVIQTADLPTLARASDFLDNFIAWASQQHVDAAAMQQLAANRAKFSTAITKVTSVTAIPASGQVDQTWLDQRYGDFNSRVATAIHSVNPAVLADLSQDNSTSIRWSVANNIHTPPQVLASLSNDLDQFVRLGAASNPNYPKELLPELAKLDYWSQVGLARNPLTPPHLLAALAQNQDGALRAAISENPAAPAQVLTDIASDSDPAIRAVVASNEATTASHLAELSNDNETIVRQAVAANPRTPAEVLRKLGHEFQPEDWRLTIRQAVAANASTPIDTLTALSYDNSASVRLAVVENSSTPESVVLSLNYDDKDPAVRDAAFWRLNALGALLF